MKCLITYDPDSNTPTSVMWLRDRVIRSNVLGVPISVHVTDVVLFSRRGVMCVTKLRDVDITPAGDYLYSEDDGDVLTIHLPHGNEFVHHDLVKYPVLFNDKRVHGNTGLGFVSRIKPQQDGEDSDVGHFLNPFRRD